MQTDVDTLLERVRSYRRHRGWSINKLAEEAKVPWSVLQNIDTDGWSPSLKTLRAVLKVIPDEFGGSPSRRRKAASSHEARA